MNYNQSYSNLITARENQSSILRAFNKCIVECRWEDEETVLGYLKDTRHLVRITIIDDNMIDIDIYKPNSTITVLSTYIRCLRMTKDDEFNNIKFHNAIN